MSEHCCKPRQTHKHKPPNTYPRTYLAVAGMKHWIGSNWIDRGRRGVDSKELKREAEERMGGWDGGFGIRCLLSAHSSSTSELCPMQAARVIWAWTFELQSSHVYRKLWGDFLNSTLFYGKHCLAINNGGRDPLATPFRTFEQAVALLPVCSSATSPAAVSVAWAANLVDSGGGVE
ncbi:hypothetical protein VTL71DRAFT_3271 [Oculimacula yallundae]|uniref:Uncharacterized protein n=1 Tax=Oculimacula yallundae TaxID=86028 RepID=A0ABR4C7U8_9HELO